MPELPYRTIHLDRGRHASHDAGMCVVELASVLELLDRLPAIGVPLEPRQVERPAVVRVA